MSENDDNMAAVMMAGLVGHNLAQVDKDTELTGTTGPAKKIDPRSFLSGLVKKEKNTKNDIMDQINREALERFPQAPLQYQQTQQAPATTVQNTVQPIGKGYSNIDPKTLSRFADASIIFAKAFDRISFSVEKYIKFITTIQETVVKSEKSTKAGK